MPQQEYDELRAIEAYFDYSRTKATAAEKGDEESDYAILYSDATEVIEKADEICRQLGNAISYIDMLIQIVAAYRKAACRG